MISRAFFVKSLFSVAASVAVPSPTSSPGEWDLCDQSNALPYDRPLGLKMRVLDGPEFDLAAYRANPVWLTVFASWCGPCAAEMPDVVAAANRYKDNGLRVIGVNVAESDNSVRAYRKRFSIPFPIAMDEQGRFSYALERGKDSGSVEFPVSLLIAPGGYLYCYKIGRMDRDEMTYRIEHFLKDAPPSR